MITQQTTTQVQTPPVSTDHERPVRGDYLKLLDIHNSNRIDYNNRKWETIKFFQGVYSFLMTATIAAIVASMKEALLGQLYLRIAIASLPICGAIGLTLAHLNLRRESRLLFMEECQMFKLAKYLNLDQSVEQEQKRWLPGDEHLLMEKWHNHKYGTKRNSSPRTFNQWVDGRVKGHLFSGLFAALFLVEIIVAVALTVIVLWAL